MGVFPACVSVHCMYPWYTNRTEESVRSLVTGVTQCESPCVCWELNPSPMEEQPVFITTE